MVVVALDEPAAQLKELAPGAVADEIPPVDPKDGTGAVVDPKGVVLVVVVVAPDDVPPNPNDPVFGAGAAKLNVEGA